ncbi:hypothetical protein EMIT0P218_100113 [Pseudomonas sp. IT-P218]
MVGFFVFYRIMDWGADRLPRINCRSWLASEGGLTAEPSLADVPDQLWERAHLYNAFIQTARVIVVDHRCDAATRQASSYRRSGTAAGD